MAVGDTTRAYFPAGSGLRGGCSMNSGFNWIEQGVGLQKPSLKDSAHLVDWLRAKDVEC